MRTWLEFVLCGLLSALVGLLLGLSLETPARARDRADSLACHQLVDELGAGQARQDRAVRAAERAIAEVVPLCGALADLQPASRRPRSGR